MAEEAVGQILEGLRIAQARRTAAIQAGLEQQRNDQQAKRDEDSRKAHEDELKLRTKAQDQAHKQAELIFKASQNLSRIREMGGLQELVGAAEAGTPIPGARKVGSRSDGQNQYETFQLPGVTQDQQVPGMIQPMPMPQEVEARTPETARRMAGALAEAKEGPGRRAAIAMELMREHARADVQDKTIKAGDDRQDKLDARAALDRDSRERIADLREQSRIANQDSTSRRDRSYNLSVEEIKDIATPITAKMERFAMLEDALNQETAIADPLVVTELAIVMSGGPGTGNRIDKAEVERLLGGRDNFEAIQAALSKWKPGGYLQIQPEQRKQIRALTKVVGDRTRVKQEIITNARTRLRDAQDVGEHRRIMDETNRALIKADGPPGAKSTEIKVKRKSDGQIGFIDAGKFDDKKYEKVVQ